MYSYGLGFIGQGASYCFISTYFVLFLTDCAEVSATLAGTISSVALLVEVVAGTVFGNLSDSCTSKLGRRRPYILVATILMPVILFFMFDKVKWEADVRFVYYIVLAIAFRVTFACFEIPNNALGTEIAGGYDDRIKLRTISRLFSVMGNGIAYILPMLALQWFSSNEPFAWQFTASVIGSVCLISWITEFIKCKKFDPVFKGNELWGPIKGKKNRNVGIDVLRNYKELLGLKSLRILVVYKAAFSSAYAIYNTAMLYYLRESAEINEGNTSKIFMLTVGFFFLMTPVINSLALKMGKANQQKYAFLVSGAIGTIVYFTGSGSMVGTVVYMICFSFIQQGFWQLSSSIFYDIVEVDEFVNNKRRAGDIMSFVSVLGSLITAIMIQVFGIMLEVVGYDAEAAMQTEGVISFLNCSFILIPSLCFIGGYLSLRAFPINKKAFESLKVALELKKAGKDYDSYNENLNKIIR